MKMKMIAASIVIAVCVSPSASAHMPDREEALRIVQETAEQCVQCCEGWQVIEDGAPTFTVDQCRVMCTVAAVEGYKVLVGADAANEIYNIVLNWLRG